MSKHCFSLEELVEGPLYQSSDEVSVNDVPDESVNETDMSENIIETVDEGATVENAVLFVQHSLEHMNVVMALGARSNEADDLSKGAKFKEGLKKIWATILEAFRRLGESIQKFFIKVSNFIRSGGIREKIAYVNQNFSKIDFKKVDGTKKVVNPKVIVLCLGVRDFKVAANFLTSDKVVDGSDPSELRAQVVNLTKEQVNIQEAVNAAKGIVTESNLKLFQTQISKVLTEAKSSYNTVMKEAKAAENSTDESKKNNASKAREVLKKISDASFLGVRGFSWFISAVNYNYGAIKGSESKTEKDEKKSSKK